ncbi:dnaJ homolog subfamily C member 2-like [Penaeus monodon]|uniref:dnaJ homolog subfamily C member 2-like n=1 Tax=Penaeus monodon TaxID=6687 RepID=UPI0018A6F2AC|nr:dnaJ homolog subfamily C member 2-like [Penaeus monodon]
MTADMDSEDSSVSVIIKRRITPLIQVEVEPVGQWFHAYEARRLRGHLISSAGESEEESEDEENPEVEIEDDIQYLRSLSPADWKNQDHYAVLGLKRYRYKASDDDIKKAYRIMVLRHHPDKRRGAGEEIRDDDDYFTCITKAYEILGDPVKRRSWDSVDPEFDDDIPPVTSHNKANFFKVFGPVIERNTRWSTRKHCPLLGKPDDSKEKVDRFYSFWYDFESWREFSYLDEEEKEKGQDREERRWIEKQNKVERARRRKEEMARLRRLVDNIYACDPRIAKFKEEERERRLAVKKARADALRQKQEEEERIKQEAEEAERKKREAEEAEQRAKQEIEKKERETLKKAIKKERKTLRTLCKDHNYYATKEDDKVQLMTDVELLCEALELNKIEDLNKELTRAGKNHSSAREVLMKEVEEIRKQIKREREEVAAAAAKGGGGGGSDSSANKPWNQDDLQLLIKAVNLFPAGTTKRWEVVSEYINQHTSTNITTRNAKEVLGKAKELLHSDQHMREAANKHAYQSLEKSQTKPSISDSTASQRFDTPQEMLGMNTMAWSPEEQRLLEQALKTYPVSTPDRWDRIAECVPNRTKKDCMRRYKELVEMVKAKKAAQAAAAKK